MDEHSLQDQEAFDVGGIVPPSEPDPRSTDSGLARMGGFPEAGPDPSAHPVEVRVVRSADGFWRWTSRWPNADAVVSRAWATRDGAVLDAIVNSQGARGVTAFHSDGISDGTSGPIPSDPIHGAPPILAGVQDAGSLRSGELGARSTSEMMARAYDAAEAADRAEAARAQRAAEHQAADAGIGAR